MLYMNNSSWIVECDCCKKGNWINGSLSESQIISQLESSGYEIYKKWGRQIVKCPSCQNKY